MPELLVKTVRELPNGNILFEKRLYFLTERDIIELRKKTNWVKGSKGLFAGSVSNGAGGSAKMTRKEFNRLCSEICSWHPNYKVGSTHCGNYGNYFYGFNVIMPGAYKFDVKIKIDGNEELIKEWRKYYGE